MKTFSKTPGFERAEEISCPLCGTERRKTKYRLDGFSFSRCGGCGLIYQYPQPVFEDLKTRYDEEYFRYEVRNERAFLDLMLKGLDDIGFPALESEIEEKRFLDVGCATGILLSCMKDRGWRTEGVELCAESAAYGARERNLSIKTGTLRDAAYDPESFSFVHFSHLIEHLNDPASFLNEVFRVLKPGGYAVAVTPNIAGFQSFLFGRNWRSAIPDHLFLFSVKTLRLLFEKCGFDVLSFGTWGGIAAGIAPAFLKKPIDRAAKRFGFGDVMVMCARKPGIFRLAAEEYPDLQTTKNAAADAGLDTR